MQNTGALDYKRFAGVPQEYCERGLFRLARPSAHPPRNRSDL